MDVHDLCSKDSISLRLMTRFLCFIRRAVWYLETWGSITRDHNLRSVLSKMRSQTRMYRHAGHGL